jgi:hypothetical protein
MKKYDYFYAIKAVPSVVLLTEAQKTSTSEEHGATAGYGVEPSVFLVKAPIEYPRAISSWTTGLFGPHVGVFTLSKNESYRLICPFPFFRTFQTNLSMGTFSVIRIHSLRVRPTKADEGVRRAWRPLLEPEQRNER